MRKFMGSRTLVVVFLLVQILLSILLISKHNIYDDEYTSLSYVEKPVNDIIHQANHGDVHPPGMYLLVHFAYRIIPSARWTVLLTVLLWDAGLFVYLWNVTPLLPSTISRLGFLLFATLHPQLLMWGLTTRWYGYWTGPALALTTIALYPESKDDPPRLSYLRSSLLGIGVAILFYVNYITLVFAAALLIAVLFRYGFRIWRQISLAVFLTALLIAPQIRPMLTVHIGAGGKQRTGAAVSFVRMSGGILTSEAFLPWHPLALLSALAGLILLVSAAIWSVKLLSRWKIISGKWTASQNGLAALCVFAGLLFFAESILGFGIKPRNGLIQIPLFAVPLALLLDRLRQRWVQMTFLVIWTSWIAAGVMHLMERRGLAKASMLNHPEEVLGLIGANSSAGTCSVLVTYDQMLSYAAAISHTNRLLLISPWPNPTPVVIPHFQLGGCMTLRVYAVESATGGLGAHGENMRTEITGLRKEIHVPPKVNYLNRDSDVDVKRRMTFLGAEVRGLPEYRYVIYEYDEVPATALDELEKNLNGFQALNM